MSTNSCPSLAICTAHPSFVSSLAEGPLSKQEERQKGGYFEDSVRVSASSSTTSTRMVSAAGIIGANNVPGASGGGDEFRSGSLLSLNECGSGGSVENAMVLSITGRVGAFKGLSAPFTRGSIGKLLASRAFATSATEARG